MIKNTALITVIGVLFLFTTISCKEKVKDTDISPQDTEVADATLEQPITLEKLKNSPAYTDAVLALETSINGAFSSGEIDFAFKVKNYELGVQTEGPSARRLANSGKGQHIHFILNNEPYSAHYESAFAKAIPDGTHHLVAFLSRSYHESVKNKNSVVVRKIQVGDNPKDSLDLDLEAPTLIYSRPKGEYSGKDTENLLLDFFVLNTTLSENGTKVRATINDQEFIITEWAPYVIKGLPKGEVSIKLELIDSDNRFIEGPFNQVSRTVNLKE